MRINQYLASAGLASRRNSEILVKDGRVKLNGAVVTTLATDVGEFDEVTLDNEPVRPKASHTYIMLNKPKGCVCTVSDDLGRKTVLDYIKEKNERLFPVGRLDYDSEGLLLLTTDGEFANLLTHPSHGIDKTYVAKIEGEVTVEHVAAIKKGIVLDGKRTAPAKCKILAFDGQESRVSVVIGEGRNRQVRRMFEALGLNVVFLKRTQVGPLRLGGLGRGMYRPLTEREIEYFLIRDPEERLQAGRAFEREENIEEDFLEAPRSEYKSSASRPDASRNRSSARSDSPRSDYRKSAPRNGSGRSYGSKSATYAPKEDGYKPRSQRSDVASGAESGKPASEGKRSYSDSKPAYRGERSRSDAPRGGSYGRSSEGRSYDRSGSPKSDAQGDGTPRNGGFAPKRDGASSYGSKPRSNFHVDSPRGNGSGRSYGSKSATYAPKEDGYKPRSQRSDAPAGAESGKPASEGKRPYSDSKPAYRGERSRSDAPRGGSNARSSESRSGGYRKPGGSSGANSSSGRSYRGAGGNRPARPRSDQAPRGSNPDGAK